MARLIMEGRAVEGEDAAVPPQPTVVPAHVRLGTEHISIATAAEGADIAAWTGRLTDVKPLLHWVLEPIDGRGYRLVPVRQWYEFARVSPAALEAAMEAEPAGRRRIQKMHEEIASKEMQQQTELRNLFAEKWKGIKLRRMERVGTSVGHGKAMATEPEQVEEAVLYPEKEFAKDDTGVKRAAKKRKKALMKEAGAVDGAEEGDVPDSANAMLKLKSAHGESGWDFEDDEQFSDDEQEKFEFDDQLETAATNVDDAPALDDEAEDNPDNPNAEDMLGSHGQELQLLLGRGGERGEDDDTADQAGSDPADNMNADEDDDDQQRRGDQDQQPIVRRTPKAKGKGKAKAKGKAQGKAGSSKAIAAKVQGPAKAAAAKARFMAPPNAPEARSMVPAPVVPLAAVRVSPASPPGVSDEQILRRRVIDQLRCNSGSCRPQALCDNLGVKGKDHPMYKILSGVLREVATVDKATRTLVLKPEYSR